ncbi:tRNA (adenosine(37)-N6)-threonylcarbamoyltransferase complex ATPase subunit type 1 TsaE [Candidatus Azambacteria bacterium]|nr:tRNA (adenosine(37)-N6)-threonylcarbamoyltransferase complex ATPase subunit type 1 TsaE [Candidatus Azambacteria bacterium]MBI3685450.1 tRNA (adenosine(37)-N6)-threonylcarbamoyltransferase complex ATPase subunit type 1 TsaE [Candidatus Azambacteria bacterium]
MSVLVTKSAEETKAVAREFARAIASEFPKGKAATVIALSGPLGAGKTTFAQGFAEGLGVKEKVKSPTFILMREHRIERRHFTRFYHLDCYRLERSKEAAAIGLLEVLAHPENLVLIEWAEKIKGALPHKKIIVKFFHVGEHSRKISFS